MRRHFMTKLYLLRHVDIQHSDTFSIHSGYKTKQDFEQITGKLKGG